MKKALAFIALAVILLPSFSTAQSAVQYDLQKFNSAGKHLLGVISDVPDLSKSELGSIFTVRIPVHVKSRVDLNAQTPVKTNSLS
jgi:hypothetical protein